MCGIAGSIGIHNSIAIDAAYRMLNSMRHRGPDGEGMQVIRGPEDSFPAVFAHTRLAVVDPSPSGSQPMANSCDMDNRCLWITFNGEIYNFRELRSELQTLGFNTVTGTDTEVILLAYRAWGLGAIAKLRGMFAFALADPANDRIWLARDRIGLKPLYYTQPRGGGFMFASEVRTLLAAGPELVPRRLSRTAVESFFAQGAVFGLESHVQNVIELGPGETVTLAWSGRNLGTKKYWSLPFDLDSSSAERSVAVGRLHDVVRESVRLHLLADVPVGVFLSSGVDSAAIATLAIEASDSPIHTVSVGFDRPQFDETPRAAEIAKRLGTHHKELLITEADICNDFELVLRSMDQPTVDGFNTYFVSRAAAALGIKVALSGLGGDELFGGYASFRDIPRAMRLGRILGHLPWSATLLKQLSKMLDSRGLCKLAEVAQRPTTMVQMYLLRRELFLPDERRALWTLPDESNVYTGLPERMMAELTTQTSGLDTGNTVSALELVGYMRNMLVRDADVFSMANGLELRAPLLDDEVVRTAVSFPGRWKSPGPPAKPLLLDSVGPGMPQQSGMQPKQGFTFPWSDWFRGRLANIASERLHTPTIWNSIGIDAEAPAKILERFHKRDPAVGGLHILGLVVLADLVARQRLTV